MKPGIHVSIIPGDRFWRRAKFRLLEPVTSAGVTVPIGTITDGASIPWFLRWLISPTGRLFVPSVVHDHLIATAPDFVSWWDARQEADRRMRQSYRERGAGAILSGLLWAALRAYAYGKAAVDKIAALWRSR